ncbi:peptidase [Burkholderia catarinensis]|uniref:peptidase n=1 Tax=Burkholderia catarinensis TaxID=1108140 RepID=UPI000910317E|nr:peptidase [Burkholderia catarinensis]KAG8149216.1 peptidase [Burkholderia catarinensis]
MSFRPGTIRSPAGAECIASVHASGLSRIELDPQQDRHARAALEAYADSAAAEMPWLAEWLDERLRDAAQHDGSGLTYCGATIERVFDLAQAWAAAQPDYAASAWDRVRGQLQRMLAQPALSEPRSPHMAADDFTEPVAGIAGAD